jgi:hypothetical protein
MRLAVGPPPLAPKKDDFLVFGFLVQWVRLDKKRGVLCWRKGDAVWSLSFAIYSLFVLLTQALIFFFSHPRYPD